MKYWWNMILARSIVFVLGAVTAAGAAAAKPAGSDDAWFIKRAVFAEGQLWLLSDTGELSSVDEGARAREVEKLPQAPLDLCLRGGSPMVVTCRDRACATWTLRQRTGGTWPVYADIDTHGDQLASLSCAPDGVTLLTTRRLVEIAGGKTTVVTLSEQVGLGTVTTLNVDAGQAFAGVNAGEWGGGLWRIDRRTGKVAPIERNATGELCDGPLNTKCDPVNGVEAEPWRPGCIVAAIGLVHFSPHGRLVEICGDEITRLYFKPYGSEPTRRSGKSDEPFETVAFFGLVRAGPSLWAAGIDGLYRIEKGRVAEVVKLPPFTTVGGIQVSFAVPHLALVLTGINWRRSISMGVPMLVAR
jgi:hypothetical protein